MVNDEGFTQSGITLAATALADRQTFGFALASHCSGRRICSFFAVADELQEGL